MSQNDWEPLSDALTDDVVRRGATAGVGAPSGGGTHVYGMRSVAVQPGVLALRCKAANFSPTPPERGGRITGALRRSALGASDGFAPFLFFCASDPSSSGQGYILGLADEAQTHIQLRKGALLGGLPGVSIVDPDAAPNILMRSTNTFEPNIWHHLRLDVIVQGTGDVVLQVFRNDLDVHSVGSPLWEVIPGMEGPFTAFNGFVDDNLGINTGTQPLTAGYMGFGTRFETANRATYFDHITCDRQLA